MDLDHGINISAFMLPFEYGSSVETSSEASNTSSADDASIITSFDIEGSVVEETIIAVTETGTSGDPDPEFGNIVEGKGRGIIVLLYGNPGVGKTLTAEAIAELRRKPMYSISVGELPTDINVFLEERAPKDMIRNGVVSVFLRTMKYC
ncbi:hypothetical protein BJ875DRAFT_445260 [Amylocarpus encephaloides]|uniref:ATPase AAA-type core domain-containing protein n=1 Tax=Amylocarpus encephaloides TaxID=45428 RepID=A0A9P7YB38_9HELO|nr:hypothetical protein BJ875DRAFT_445260 [Amylocarpus encephaloides]